jgi:hypothetical protein
MLRAMVKRFREAFDATLARRALALGLSEQQVVTLASLVEEETGRPEERRLIAAVFMNRLRAGCRSSRTRRCSTAVRTTTARSRAPTSPGRRPYNTYTIPGCRPRRSRTRPRVARGRRRSRARRLSLLRRARRRHARVLGDARGAQHRGRALPEARALTASRPARSRCSTDDAFTRISLAAPG